MQILYKHDVLVHVTVLNIAATVSLLRCFVVRHIDKLLFTN